MSWFLRLSGYRALFLEVLSKDIFGRLASKIEAVQNEWNIARVGVHGPPVNAAEPGCIGKGFDPYFVA